jgi:membrane fusion protein, multidrug efflux system
MASMDQLLKPPKEALRIDKDKETAPAIRRKSRRGFAWLLLPALLVIGAIAYRYYEKPAASPQGGPRNATVVSIVPEVVGKGDIGISLNALGTVTSLATVTIRSQISGYLQKVDFKEGDEVKKGDLLVEIDPRPYEAALALAKGNLARDEALLKGAKVDLDRYQGLAAKNAVPRQTLDTQVALVAQDQGLVEADRAAVRAAEVNLQYCRITSPLDGRVGLRQVDQGNYVTPGDANGIVVITQLHPISVLFTVPEDNLPAISKRLAARATLPATAYDRSGVSKLDDGVLQTFDSQIDPTTGTIKLRAQFPNDKRTLYPNQFVNVRLLVDSRKDVTLMPTAGIQRGVPGTFVYLVNADSTVSVRKVELGATDGSRVEVRSGLSPGDRIVIDGADKLRDGAKINLRTEANASSAPQQPDATNRQQRRSGGKP